MATACACSEKAQQRNNGFCQHLCLGQVAPSRHCPEAWQSVPPQYVSGDFQATSAELMLRTSESVSQSMCGPFKRNPGTPTVLHLTQPQSSLVFTAVSYEDFSSWHWSTRLGEPGVGLSDCLLLRGDLCSYDIPPDFYLPHLSMRPAGFISLPFLPVLMWLLLYILSYRTSVQLDFRWFSMMAVL